MPRQSKKIPQPEPKSKKAPVQKTLPPEVPDHKLKKLAEMRAERLASTASPASAFGTQMGRDYKSPEAMHHLWVGIRNLAAQESDKPSAGDTLLGLAFGLERLAYEYWGPEGLAILQGDQPGDSLPMPQTEEPASEETGSDDEGELDLTLTGAGDLRAALSS